MSQPVGLAAAALLVNVFAGKTVVLVAAVAAACAGFAGALVSVALRRRRRKAPQRTYFYFRLDGTEAVAPTAAARRYIDAAPPGDTVYGRLRAALFDADEKNGKRLDRLAMHGQPFTSIVILPSGELAEVNGRPVGSLAEVVFQSAGQGSLTLRDLESRLRQSEAENARLRAVLDSAPVQAFSVSPSGRVDWGNAAYVQAAGGGQAGDAAALVSEPYHTPLPRDDASWERQLVERGGRWLDVVRVPRDDGGFTGYAIDVSPRVRAETSLKNFMSTLTETFVHLETGLAVFDDNRMLSLFNPALGSLTGLDPSALARKPSLRDFFEMLRAQRKVPEQRDFLAWKRKLTEVETGAAEGSYQEIWPLPGGEVYRVTGKPQVHGGIAFLFEDISRHVMLERRYRAELELSQLIFDRIADGIAVFDQSGTLVMSNSTFDAIWGVDTLSELRGRDVHDLARVWEEACLPLPVFEDIRAYASGADSRARWRVHLDLLDGRSIFVTLTSLPERSTLMIFRDVSAYDQTVTELEALEARFATERDLTRASLEVMLATLDGRTGDDGGPLSPPSPAPTPADIIERTRKLAAFLTRHGLAEMPARLKPNGMTDRIRMHFSRAEQPVRFNGLELLGRMPAGGDAGRVLWALACAAGDMSAAGCAVDISAEMAEQVPVLIARITAEPRNVAPGGRPASFRLLEQLVEAGGGSTSLAGDPDGRSTVIRVRLTGNGKLHAVHAA
jgi:PAS domain-containing protein